jgi:hypothetical protein
MFMVVSGMIVDGLPAGGEAVDPPIAGGFAGSAGDRPAPQKPSGASARAEAETPHSAARSATEGLKQ